MKKSDLKILTSELFASIVVLFTSAFLCMAVAMASGAPVYSGLIAGGIGGIVVGFLSRSNLSISAPFVGLTSITSVAIMSLPTFNAFLGSVVICGLLQVVLGILKAGALGTYIPRTVLKGIVSAIGIMLIIAMFPGLLGISDSPILFSEAIKQIVPGDKTLWDQINDKSAVFGIAGLLTLIVWDKKAVRKKVPGPIVVIVLSIVVQQILKFGSPDLALGGSDVLTIPSVLSAKELLSNLQMPDWQYLFNKQVLFSGITLGLVASVESLISIEAVDDIDPYKRSTPTNRELKAQGIGNIVSGMLGGLPMTSSIVPSSVKYYSGSKTKKSTLFYGTLLIGSIILMPGIFSLVPKATVAAILAYIGYKLTNAGQFKQYYLKGMSLFLPFVITISAILITDLLKGILIGIVSGLFFVVRSNFRSAVLLVQDGTNYLVRLRKDVSFLNKPILKAKLEQIPSGSRVLIDSTHADFIDSDVIEVIENFMLQAPMKSIQVELRRHKWEDQGFTRGAAPDTKDDSVYVNIYLPAKNVSHIDAELITKYSIEILEAVGFEFLKEEDAVYSSFWKKLKFVFSRHITWKEIDDAFFKAKKALELQHVELPTAEQTEKLCNSAEKLVAILDRQEEGVIRLGAILVLKIKVSGKSEIHIRQLDYKTVKYFDENPYLMRNLQNIYTTVIADNNQKKLNG